MRVAAIDIGTNSVRCTIVEVPVGGPRNTLDDEKEYTRLGRGVAATGRLSEKAIDDTIAALGRMLSIAEQCQVTHVRAIATAAVRNASNSEELIERAIDQLGLEIEVVSEEEEARLAFLSAVESVRVDGRWAMVDIGGGSVEVVRATDRQIEFIASLPIGAVVMSERYHTQDPIPKHDYQRLSKHVRRMLARALGDDPHPVTTLVGSGGTVGAVAALVAAKRENGLTSLHRFELRRSDVIHTLASLAGKSAEERSAVKGMSENRVDIIVAGAVVLDECMRALGANELTYNARGIREGIVIDTIERERGSTAPQDRMQSAREFGRKCHTDVGHAEQVRILALALLDELEPRIGLDPTARPLLEAAALLHDVGYHIAYERHHKHSYHLISYAEIPGFSPKELRLIAAVARYHRGALPKPKHEALNDLGRKERELVTQLAAILRLADGLDRSRGQRVKSLNIEDGPSGLVLNLLGDASLAVEVHGAQRKADLFEEVFNTRVDVLEASTG